jgi:Phosphotransferase enzyme family
MLILSSQNVANYLEYRGICQSSDIKQGEIALKHGKNFNLLVETTAAAFFLVKQERLKEKQSTSREFVREWRVREWLDSKAELKNLHHLMPEILDFDRDNAILVVKYYNDSRDLQAFYRQQETFPERIAACLGEAIATIHSRTFNAEGDRRFLQPKPSPAEKILRAIDKLRPDVFGTFCADGIEFFRLYQRHDSIRQKIFQLQELWYPCCLTHGDLKLDNILVNLSITDTESNPIRFIDWEKFFWGDPAYDLATIIECYLKIWLKSLLVSSAIDINLSLKLASTPLEAMQPSLVALITNYLAHFPQILADTPYFCQRLMQLTGYIAINKIVQHLESHIPFDNRSICTLQVAKTLLCRPQEAFAFVFGRSEAEILNGVALLPSQLNSNLPTTDHDIIFAN